MEIRRSALLRLRYSQVSTGHRLEASRERARGDRAIVRVVYQLSHRITARRRYAGGLMRFALVNPNWSFHGSIYFGCREPHLPLEFGYSKDLLERASHEVLMLDAQLNNLNHEEICDILRRFRPKITVVTTAPSYLFWRCPPPELSVPKNVIRAIRPF